MTLRSLILMMVMVAAVAVISAEIPPMEFLEAQDIAPERVDITVISVKAGNCDPGEFCNIDVVARVDKVYRTVTDLKEGDEIKIKYERLNPPEGYEGLKPITFLQTGKTYPAFLQTYRYSWYVPVAGVASFLSFQETIELELTIAQNGIKDVQEQVESIKKFLDE